MCIQCDAIIMLSIFTQIFTKEAQSSPVRARYRVSFMNITSAAYFALVIVVPYAKSCYVGPLYNGTWLYLMGYMEYRMWKAIFESLVGAVITYLCKDFPGQSQLNCTIILLEYWQDILTRLSEELSYECPRCRGVPGVRPVDGRPFKEVEVGDCVLEAVDRFCYLGDMLSAGGGCMAAATARCRCAWGKFWENLPLLTSKPVPLDLRGHLFSCYVRSSMLLGTETWPMTSAALHRLCPNDRAMIRWICGVKPSDDPSMDELHAKLRICDLAILVRERRLRWFGHVMRSNGEINRVRSRPVPGRKGPGRPKKTWEECVKQDLKVCGLSEAGTQDRLSWRSSVKNSRQEPTPSNGSLPQSMAAPPAQRVLGMRTRSFNKTGFDWLIDWHVVCVW